MPEEDVVVLAEEANRSRDVRVGPWCVGKVEELSPALVLEDDQALAEPLDDVLQPCQAGPVLDVGNRRRPECPEVAQDEVVDRGLGLELAPSPRFDRRELRLTALPPDPAGSDLDEGQMRASRVADRLGVIAEPSRDETSTELPPAERLLGEQLARRLHQRLDVGAAHPAAVVTAPVLPLRHDLRQRLERERVLDGGEMDRPAHEPEPDDLPLLEQPPELVRVEAVESGPEPVVRRHDLLGLEPDEVLDHVLHRHVGAAEQVLALQQRAVQRAATEDLGAQSTSLRVIAMIAMRHIRIPKPTRKARCATSTQPAQP